MAVKEAIKNTLLNLKRIPEESTLHWAYKSILSQLRSEHYIVLNNYCSNMGINSDPSSPHMAVGTCTTPHTFFFTCAAHPT